MEPRRKLTIKASHYFHKLLQSHNNGGLSLTKNSCNSQALVTTEDPGAMLQHPHLFNKPFFSRKPHKCTLIVMCYILDHWMFVRMHESWIGRLKVAKIGFRRRLVMGCKGQLGDCCIAQRVASVWVLRLWLHNCLFVCILQGTTTSLRLLKTIDTALS